MDYSYGLKIPKDRIAVLIGKDGEIKAELESLTETTISIDSKEGDVTIKGADSLSIYQLKDVIIAIGRGYNPEIARLLLKQDYILEVIPIAERAKTKAHLERIRGRIIGAGGKARGTIENLTETFISIYGKTISVLGPPEGVVLAKKAIESLIEGSPHSNVYRWLEKNRKKRREKEAVEW